MTSAAEVSEIHGAGGCFLCALPSDLVYAESEHFIALLGLGPIAEGYSLIAARAHVSSMLDILPHQRTELASFTEAVRRRLRPHYGESVITEHGRVPPCLSEYARTHEPHCLHAHRLVFPGSPLFDLVEVARGLEVRSFCTFRDAAASFRDPGQYLYVEHPDGGCQLASVRGPLPRQFFRRVVAATSGVPELADWREHPSHDLIHAASARLGVQHA